MKSWMRVFSSSVGMKIVMAASGALLSLFLVAHMVGNLEIYAGAGSLNGYAALLRVWPPLLPLARLGLLVLAALHIASSIRLTQLNRAARPAGYVKKKTLATTLAARTMLVSGIVVAGFVVFHILHFTAHTVEPGYASMHDASGRHDVFGMLLDAFQRPPVALFYVAAMLLLGLHLSHGVASLFQTLGVDHPRYGTTFKYLGPVFAILLVLGFVAVPLSVLLGVVHAGSGGH